MARELDGIEQRVRELEVELQRARDAIAELTKRLQDISDATPALLPTSEHSGEHGQLSSNGLSWSRESQTTASLKHSARQSWTGGSGTNRKGESTDSRGTIGRESSIGRGGPEVVQDLRRREELEQIARIKNEFISIAAHEFRTPMTSIVGYLDLIMEGRLGPVPEPLKKPIASIARNVQRLKRLVEDMLDISRLESGRVTLVCEPTDLGTLVELAIADMGSFLRSGIHTICTQLEPLPSLMLDCEKMRRAIGSLVANAIKYSQKGGSIVISLREEDGCAVLTVEMSGKWPEDTAGEKIFEPFSEVTAPEYHSSAVPDPAGLGLAIARRIVALHGGELAFGNTKEGHSAFTMKLPLSTTK